MTASADPHADLGQARAHSARAYDYILGGKTNYLADRQAAGEVLRVFPGALITARENRAFMHRATRYATEELGIRQFLDIGTGVPTAPNLYEVAQRFRPDARVVYVDNDPIVLTYARALLTAGPPAAISYIDADVRAPETILERAAETLDFTQPVALSLVALLHFIPHDDDPYGLLARLVARLAPGSLLVLSHATTDFDDTQEGVPPFAGAVDVYRAQGIPVRTTTRDEIAAFFDELELVEPGIVPTSDWRPDLDLAAGMQRLPGMLSPAEVAVYAGVGHKH